VTTQEKVRALVDSLTAADIGELAPDLRWVFEGVNILRGLGVVPSNPIDFLLPDDPAEADVLVDKLIALLFELRGDDLPPFDPARYGESVVAELTRREPA